MKKFYLGVLGCLLAMGASAQISDSGIDLNGVLLFSTGKEVTTSGKSIAYILENYQDGYVSVKLYNEGFEEIRSLNVYLGSSEGISTPLIDLDEPLVSDADNYSFFLTQTLFNNDDKFEFVRCVEKYEEYKYTAFEVVNEDNEVLATINSPADSYRSYPRILKWNGKYYFGIYSYTNDYTCFWDIYLIEKETNSVRKVNAAPLMSVMPVLAERNSTVNVTLDAETAKNGGELVITDSNGRTVGRSHVEAGQTSIPVTTDRMGSGVYNITLTEKGQKVENARIIVK